MLSTKISNSSSVIVGSSLILKIFLISLLKSCGESISTSTNKKGTKAFVIGIVLEVVIIPAIVIGGMLIGVCFRDDYVDEYNNVFKPYYNNENSNYMV